MYSLYPQQGYITIAHPKYGVAARRAG